MTSQLSAICFRTKQPSDLARFWSGLLGWELTAGPDGGIAILPPDPAAFRVRFLPGQEPKTVQNRALWSKALGWPLVWDQDEETAIQSPHGGTKITWGGPPVAPQTGTNRLYVELVLPAGADVEQEIERLISLGALRTDAGAGGGEGGRVLLLDPDGNEFSVLRR